MDQKDSLRPPDAGASLCVPATPSSPAAVAVTGPVLHHVHVVWTP